MIVDIHITGSHIKGIENRMGDNLMEGILTMIAIGISTVVVEVVQIKKVSTLLLIPIYTLIHHTIINSLNSWINLTLKKHYNKLNSALELPFAIMICNLTQNCFKHWEAYQLLNRSSLQSRLIVKTKLINAFWSDSYL